MLSPLAWLAIALAFLPYAAKRVALLGTPPYLDWLFWDYGARLAMLCGVALAYCAGLVGPIGPPATWKKTIGLLLLALIAERMLSGWLGPVLMVHLGHLHFSNHPPPSDQGLFFFDLLVGIWLVAISEEFVFRRLVFTLLERIGFGYDALGRAAIVAVSAVVFGLMHLPMGADIAVHATLFGLIVGTLFAATRRLWPCIVAHYVEDAVGFLQLGHWAGMF
jgi:membrane protease YdiL (CAAX protease family)